MLETIAETLRATIAVGLVLAGILAILIWVRNLTKKLNNLKAIHSDSSFDRDFCVFAFLAHSLESHTFMSHIFNSLKLSKHRTFRQTNLQI